LDDSEGIEIGPVTARLDWERRYKLMRHHSLLHVLAAVVYRKFNALDSGNQIYPERARIDFHGLHDLTEQDIADIVEETNRLLDEDHPIYASYVTREEAEKLSNVIKDAVSMLPSTIKRVRLLTIESVETYPCGGTHVKSTREIGKMEIIKVKSRGKGRKRFEVFARDK